MSFSRQKGEFDRFLNRLDRPVEESRPDRFPSLVCTLVVFCIFVCNAYGIILVFFPKSRDQVKHFPIFRIFFQYRELGNLIKNLKFES